MSEEVRDCRTCRHGKYNDHYALPFCYSDQECNDWDQWEPNPEEEKDDCKGN